MKYEFYFILLVLYLICQNIVICLIKNEILFPDFLLLLFYIQLIIILLIFYERSSFEITQKYLKIINLFIIKQLFSNNLKCFISR